MKENKTYIDHAMREHIIFYVSNGGYFDLNLSLYIDESGNVHDIKKSGAEFLSILFEDGKIDIYNSDYSNDNIRQIAKRINDSIKINSVTNRGNKSKSSAFLITDTYGTYIINPAFSIKDTPFSEYEIFRNNKFKEALSSLGLEDFKILYLLYLMGSLGLNLDYTELWLGLDLRDEYSHILNKLESNGYISLDNNSLYITSLGCILCKGIIEDGIFDLEVVRPSFSFFESIIRDNTYYMTYNRNYFCEIQFNIIKTLINEIKPVENWILLYIATAADEVRCVRPDLTADCAKYIDYAWNNYDDSTDTIGNKLGLLRICIYGGNTRAALKEQGYRAAIRYFNAAEETVDTYIKPISLENFNDDFYYHLGWFYNDIGYFYLRYSDYDNNHQFYLDLSEKYLLEAHKVKKAYVTNYPENIRAQKTLAVSCSNLSNLYRHKALYEEALKYVTECLDIRQKIGLEHYIARAQALKARIYLAWYLDCNDDTLLIKAKLIIDQALNKWLEEKKKNDENIKSMDMRIPFLTDDPDDVLYRMLRTKVEIENLLGNNYFAMHFGTYLPEEE